MHQFDPNLEIEFPPGSGNMIAAAKGDITSVTVLEQPPPTGGLPNHVINPERAFTVRVNWEVTGVLAPLWLAALEDSDWRVSCFAESMGPGPEIELGTVNVDADSGQLAYEADIVVNPPSGLTEHLPDSGVYKLTVTVFLNSNLGEPGYDMIGFAEGPFIQVEDTE